MSSFLFSTNGAFTVIGVATFYYFFLRKKRRPVASWIKNKSSNVSVITEIEEGLQVIKDVRAKKDEWKKLDYKKKLAILREILANVEVLKEEWAQRELEFRGLKNEKERYGGFGKIMGPTLTAIMTNATIKSYESLVATGKPPPPARVTQQGDHKIAVIFPMNTKEKLVAGGGRGELWLKAGAPVKQFTPNEGETGLCLILGPGNYEHPNDIFTKLFVEGKVAVFKTHPINEHSTNYIYPRLLEPLIRRGYLAVLSGGVDFSQAMLRSPDVDEALMTGGAPTHDIIVWGPPSQQAANKKSGNRQFTKRFDSELGAASPWIVVPGKWSPKEIAYNTKNLVGSKLYNAGHVCASPQVLVLDADWDQTEQFVASMKKQFQAFKSNPYYYVGTKKRLDDFKSKIPEIQQLDGAAPEGHFNLHLVDDVDNATNGSFACQTEAFGPFLAIKYVRAGGDPATFLKLATKVANDECSGSLSLSVIIHATTEKNNQAAFEKFLEDLNWASIAVNQWGGNVPSKFQMRWGGLPGLHTLEDVGSGIGDIGNCYMYENTYKSVLRAPWMNQGAMMPMSPRKSLIYSRVCEFAISESWGDFAKMAAALLLGI